jgi:uncharacterized protein YcnI
VKHPAFVAATSVTILTLLATPAAAHVGTSASEVPAGGSLDLGLTIGHGCDGSPTRQVVVQIPDPVNSASAYAKPGWAIDIETEDLNPPVQAGHGQTISERTSTITFTADTGNELPNELRDTFTIRFTAPDDAGDRLFFKTIQRCTVGETAWIQEYDGEGEEPESPSPTVLIVAAEEEGDDHGATAEDDHDDEAATEDDTAATADSDGDDGDSATGIAVAGLVTGILGLAAGGTALARSRRSS